MVQREQMLNRFVFLTASLRGAQDCHQCINSPLRPICADCRRVYQPPQLSRDTCWLISVLRHAVAPRCCCLLSNQPRNEINTATVRWQLLICRKLSLVTLSHPWRILGRNQRRDQKLRAVVNGADINIFNYCVRWLYRHASNNNAVPRRPAQ